LVLAAYNIGLWAQAFPFFGAERRGAPVTAFARIGKVRIRTRSMIRNPDVVVILDPQLLKSTDVLKGLKNGGKIVINSPSATGTGLGNYIIYYVDATKIALDLNLVLAGWPLVNTAILGALAKAINIPIGAVEDAVTAYLGGRGGDVNALAARKAYNEVRVIEH